MESEKQHELSQKNCSRNFSGAAQVKERPLRVGDSQALCEELSTDVGVWTWTRPTPAQGGSYRQQAAPGASSPQGRWGEPPARGEAGLSSGLCSRPRLSGSAVCWDPLEEGGFAGGGP